MKIVLLDNYDSFTYNLEHLLVQCDVEVDIFRNDRIGLDAVAVYDGIVLSPGPGLPSGAGIMQELIQKYAASKPILGVCLGHQGIAEAFGGTLLNTDKVWHGVAKKVIVVDKTEVLFSDGENIFEAGRYHSWLVDRKTLPDCFTVTAVDEEDNIMAIAHKTFPVKGVQFHPESILTEGGIGIVGSWIKDIKKRSHHIPQ